MKVVGIFGYGEVGKSIADLYKGTNYVVRIKDIDYDDGIFGSDLLHICIPYNEQFYNYVKEAIKEYNPLLTIIHSSVLPGTTSKLQAELNGGFVVHSPVRGVHPRLTESLYTFIKYIGSDTDEGYILARDHFDSLLIQTERLNSSKTTEIAKLLCTSYYGMCIAWHDMADNICSEHGISYDDINKWNTTYNDGYTALNMGNVARPVLYPPKGRIGGHCVIPNAEILKQFYPDNILDFILKLK